METRKRDEVIYEHIMDCFDSEEEVVETIDEMLRSNCELKEACEEVVRNGGLLVYHESVDEFLEDELGCSISNDGARNFELYARMIGLRLQKIYRRNKI